MTISRRAFAKTYPTPAARARAIKRSEVTAAASTARATADLATRDDMIRAALALGDNASELADTLGFARTYVYRIRDKKPGRKTE